MTTLQTPSPIKNGKAAAAILAAGIGCFAMGAIAVAADGSKPLAHALTFIRATGPLSGVSTVAIALWLLTWALLASLWKAKDLNLGRISTLALTLLAVGLLLTFPPFGDRLLGR